MRIDVYHQKDDPTGLHLFVLVPEGSSLATVPLTLGSWTTTGVAMDLCPIQDMGACDDIADNGFALMGSEFIRRLPAGAML